MHCIKKITDDIFWVGVNDRRLAMFEGVYSVPRGVSYNSYLVKDEKTVLFDTVDKSSLLRFIENLEEALGGRKLDYLVTQHIEPDHSASMRELIYRYPEMEIVCNNKSLALIKQFNDFDADSRAYVVKEGDVLNTGKRSFTFIMAPMVHWPEVMVSYETTGKILFSADAFGCFGALNGALFADEVDFNRDYMDEARRYYTNIVGKYGGQVKALLDKTSGVQIDMALPLHGFVWRKNFRDILSKYLLWSCYEPEENGVMIAYASVYGNTENAAEILSCKLREKNIKTVMFDVSVTAPSDIVSEAFKWSHFVFASTTYNAGIFVTMETLLHDFAAHNIQNRTIALIENGSWAPVSGNLMREALSKCKNLNILEKTVSIKSGVKAKQLNDIDAMADALAESLQVQNAGASVKKPDESAVDPLAMFKIPYGLFVLTAKDDRDNGCIINTALQITAVPIRISVTVSKANHTRDMIMKTGTFNISVLTESAPFSVIERFGFASGKDTDKFAGCAYNDRTANGLRYIPDNTNCVISAKVIESYDYETHTIFTADVTEARALSDEPSLTYDYYFRHVKPKPQKVGEKKKGYVCRVCAYFYEGEELPADFICPLCKHGADDFDKTG